jgi:hypothetical protein
MVFLLVKKSINNSSYYIAPAYATAFTSLGITGGAVTNGYLQMKATPFDIPSLCTVNNLYLPIKFVYFGGGCC